LLVVDIPSPPPEFTPNPIYFKIEAGKKLRRIFNPTQYNVQALTFKYFGPHGRFDHHRIQEDGKPSEDPDRGIYYAAFELSCCLAEVFGCTIDRESLINKKLCLVETNRDLLLLDLRTVDNIAGATRAGSVFALSSVPNRVITQAWSRYFYDRVDIYGNIDGICYPGAYTGQDAIVLYERSKSALICPENRVMDLDSPALFPAIQQAAEDNGLRIL
jgi:RES domain